MKTSLKILIGLALLALYLLSLVSMTSALVIDSVIMDSEGISPGETADIEIGLKNNGEEDVSDVSVYLDLKDIPFAPFDSSSEFGIDEIREGKTKYAKFEIIALSNAKSQTYKIPVEISYTEEEVVKIKNSLISINVNSEPVIGVLGEDDLLIKGRESEVVIKIINKGLSDIRFLEVEVGSSSYFNLLSQKNVYVGDLDSDDFDSVDFNVFFKNSVSDNFNFPVVLKYQDAFNNKYEKSFDVQLKVYSKDKAIELGLIEKSNTSLYFGGVVVLVVGFFGYRWWRKRKRLKKVNGSNEEFWLGL